MTALIVVLLVVVLAAALVVAALLYSRLRAERIRAQIAEAQQRAFDEQMDEAFAWGLFDGFNPNEEPVDYEFDPNLPYEEQKPKPITDRFGSFTIGVDMSPEEFDPNDLTKGGSFSLPEKALLAPDEMRRPAAVPRWMTITQRARGHFASRWSHESQVDEP